MASFEAGAPSSGLAALQPRPSTPLVAARREAAAFAPWRVERLSEPAALEGLREEWSDLLQSSWSNGLFLTWEWLSTWWKHCAHHSELSILTVRYGRDLLGLAPLVTAPSTSYGPIAAPALKFLGFGNVGSDYLDLIVRPARRAETVAAFADWLDRDRRWILDLKQVPSSGSSSARLAEQLQRRGWRSSRQVIYRCPYIALEGLSFDGYLQSLGSSHRYNFRRRQRQLERGFDLCFERVHTEDERRDALDALIDLHRQRFESRGGSDAFHDPALRAFHREFSAIALRRGWLRLYVLRLDGHPAAALYAFRYGRRVLFYQAGFDPAFARHSVGLVAMGLAIRDAIEEGASEYDLLHGEEPYKALWARSGRELESIELFPPTPSGLAHGLLRGTRRWARRGFERLAKRSALPSSGRPEVVE
jgi:CelD/BcsL family acetyltransferase involved in cellulose biosynthesis